MTFPPEISRIRTNNRRAFATWAMTGEIKAVHQDFLTALLTGDLNKAVFLSIDETQEFKNYDERLKRHTSEVKWTHEDLALYLPSNCHGSPEIVQTWKGLINMDPREQHLVDVSHPWVIYDYYALKRD